MEPGSAAPRPGAEGANQQGIDNFEKKLQDQTNELNSLNPNVSNCQEQTDGCFEFQIRLLNVYFVSFAG